MTVPEIRPLKGIECNANSDFSDSYLQECPLYGTVHSYAGPRRKHMEELRVIIPLLLQLCSLGMCYKHRMAAILSTSHPMLAAAPETGSRGGTQDLKFGPLTHPPIYRVIGMKPLFLFVL